MAEIGVAASIVGITVPALHGARLLLNDIQQIKGAPKAIVILKNELRSLKMAYDSLKAVEQSDWDSLGDNVADQAKVVVTTCEEACNLFRADLQHWTKHSGDGTLSWQDKLNVGFFKQQRIKALSDQLRNCFSMMNLVVSVATLYVFSAWLDSVDRDTDATVYRYSSFHQSHVTEENQRAVSERRADIEDAIVVSDEDLAEVQTTLEQLQLAGANGEAFGKEGQTDKNAVKQVEEEHKALLATKKILEGLLPKTEEQAIKDAGEQAPQQSIQVTFGDNNRGSQIGVNNAPIHDMHFGRWNE
jgi:hypothetical protein